MVLLNYTINCACFGSFFISGCFILPILHTNLLILFQIKKNVTNVIFCLL